jgi:type II secretory ATPase GspE/PulE/Tfp pilus assembly ATPase PilB-like protein
VGCDKCNKTGYKGRIGLHELLIADDDVKKLIQERARVADLFVAVEVAACAPSRWTAWKRS